ncbi:hypothetical protein ACO0LG_07890 [Undibacterium sp. Ji42W]|uniref:hypothetical protein n=1 Tax=Undibacterium sp. Ji42W TaxID=3413039 RepID=UPI003BF26BE7
MDSTVQEWMTSRLNGYVMAMAHIDGIPGDAIANAHIFDLDENDLLESLRRHLEQAPGDQYVYGEMTEIHDPWSRQVVIALDAFFFRHPFAGLTEHESRQVKATREGMVTRIEDLIGMITDHYSCRKIYRVEMRSNSGHAGHMHIFPLSHRFLVFKTISRL